MIRFDCVCGRQLQADPKQSGSRAACPACGRVVSVPDATAGVRSADPWYGTVAPPVPVAPPDSPVAPEPMNVEPVPGSDFKEYSGKALAVVPLAALLTLLSLAVAASCPVPVRYGLATADSLVILLAAAALRDVVRSHGQLAGGWMAWSGLAVGLVSLGVVLFFATPIPYESSYPLWQANNMKQIGLALHDYAAANGRLPPAASRDPDGKLLLSWRVAVLPYVEEDRLYKQFHLDEPWDSPHNIQLLPRIPRVFEDTTVNRSQGLTRIQVYVGPGTAFESPQGQLFAEFPKGAYMTVLFVEGPDPVPWTKPMDLPFGPQVMLVRPYPRWKEKHRCLIMAADCSIHTIPADTPEETLRALISRNGEKAEWP